MSTSDTELRRASNPGNSNLSLQERSTHDSSANESQFAPVQSQTSRPNNRDDSTREGHLDGAEDRDALARRQTTNSLGRHQSNEDWSEIQRLMSRMFGRERQEHSEEEKTRHSGVIWKNLNVKGAGLGAALQPTVGDIFLGLPRLVKGLLTRGRKGVPVKTILHDFTVSHLHSFLVLRVHRDSC